MKQKRRLAITRLMLLALAAITLLWSGVEDQDVVTVTALGIAISIAGVAWFLAKCGPSAEQTRFTSVFSALILGSLIGALSSLITVALMLFKDIRHGHPFPDYPPALMLAMLERLPIWTIAGALIGLGCALLLEVFGDSRNGRG